MTPEQEIRAAAVQAAASFCAPIGSAGQSIPDMEDVLFVADVFKGYVENGWEAALQIYATSAKQQVSQSGQDVELREQHPVQDVQLPQAEAPTQQPLTPSAPATDVVPEIEPPSADVIPIEARGVVTKKQVKSRTYLDKIKAKRAEGIAKMAKVAKTEEHKERLREDAQESGLLDFPVRINGQDIELGRYLASL